MFSFLFFKNFRFINYRNSPLDKWIIRMKYQDIPTAKYNDFFTTEVAIGTLCSRKVNLKKIFSFEIRL